MYLGIDLGTSGVKLLLLTKEGKVVKTTTKSYDLIFPNPGWTEQNPNDWYEATIKGLKEIVVGYEDNIKAIGFSGQMHGMVLLDENDNVIRNAILWNDQRTQNEVDYLNNKIGKDFLIKETGNIAITGLTAPKILWVKNNEPENFKKINKIMLPKDYLSYKLSNVFASDYTDASGTLYLDVNNKKYSKKVLEILDVKESWLPKLYESYEVVGNLTEELQKLLKLKSDVKVVIGGSDQSVGAIGVGIVDEGRCNISLGTSGVIFTAMSHFKDDKETNMQVYAHANNNYHMMGVMLNAAGSLKWWLEGILEEENYDDFFENLSSRSIHDDIYFLPYLSGERAPVHNPNARGMFLGLRMDHKREDLNSAVIEGISFNLKMIYDNITKKGIKINSSRVTGGGAKSPIWVQTLSNIFNIDVETIEIEEGPALGAAILAMVGDGAYTNLTEACEVIIKGKQVYKPELDKVQLYEKKFQEYLKIYPIISPIYELKSELKKSR